LANNVNEAMTVIEIIEITFLNLFIFTALQVN